VTEKEHRANIQGKQKGRVSLQPLPFEEAVGDILKVKPSPEKKKRRGKRRKKASRERAKK